MNFYINKPQFELNYWTKTNLLLSSDRKKKKKKKESSAIACGLEWGYSLVFMLALTLTSLWLVTGKVKGTSYRKSEGGLVTGRVKGTGYRKSERGLVTERVKGDWLQEAWRGLVTGRVKGDWLQEEWRGGNGSWQGEVMGADRGR